MSDWHAVCPLSELPSNTRKDLIIEGIPILIFNLEGDYYAIQNQCTHQAFPLTEGLLSGEVLTCPFHGAQFCIKTGEALTAPAFEELPTYPVRVQNDLIEVKLF